MSQSIKPIDVGTRIQNALRDAVGGKSGGYICPLCQESSHAGPKIWEHAKTAHPNSTDLMGCSDEAEAKRQFIERARKYFMVGGQPRTTSNKADGGTKGSSNDDSPTQADIREGTRDIDNVRPRSAPGFQGPDRQSRNTGALPSVHHRPREPLEKNTLSNNPRKRGAEDNIFSYGLYSEGYNTKSMDPRAHHNKTISGGGLPDYMDTYCQGTPPDDMVFRRTTSGPKQPLWDPEKDSPVTDRRTRRDKAQGFSNSLRRPQPQDNSFSNNMAPVSFPDDGRPSQGGIRDITMANTNLVLSEQARAAVNRPKGRNPPSHESSPTEEHLEGPDEEPEMLLQPETRPISHEQLVVEVKGIYAGLVMVEAKCIDIDERQTLAAQEKDPTKRVALKNDQWQSLIALHKQLLHEHHDFFLASQHPSASPALSRLAAKYSMPARMWRHGIHAFLEVLRHRLPESLEHMLAFIYIAYSMMALLYETVSTFEDTWIECLGDLGRYRMAIEDDEPKDREVWSNVARFWYNKAADKSPSVGRLYHHLAILARPYTLEQLSLYARSLTCITPFESARGSIMTLFNPILQGKDSVNRRGSSFEVVLIKVHAILFTSNPLQLSDSFDAAFSELSKEGLFESHVRKANAKFKEIGSYAAVSNLAALLEYGISKEGLSKPNLRLAIEDAAKAKEDSQKASPNSKSNGPEDLPPSAGPPQMDIESVGDSLPESSALFLSRASRLAFWIFAMALERLRDRNVYPLVHIYLTFLWSLRDVEKAWVLIGRDVPWESICSFLNILFLEFETMKAKDLAKAHARLRKSDFPVPEEGIGRPLWEDFIMRGQLYTQRYFTLTWFSDSMIDDDERGVEMPSMNELRVERMLWVAHGIASVGKWIRYDEKGTCFSLTDHTKANPVIAHTPASSLMDQDTAMFDAATIETMSSGTSDSQIASKLTTSASTPTEIHAESPHERPSTPKALGSGEDHLDTPMVDLSPTKGQQPMTDPTELDKPDPMSWSRNTAVNRVSSKRLEQRPEDRHLSDPNKLKGLDEHSRPEDAGTPIY